MKTSKVPVIQSRSPFHPVTLRILLFLSSFFFPQTAGPEAQYKSPRVKRRRVNESPGAENKMGVEVFGPGFGPRSV